jgi:hypothetical protein
VGLAVQTYALDFEAMSNLPKAFRAQLAEEATLGMGQVVDELHSSDGQTKKLLFQLPDGQYIETVLMKYEKRRTLCISTQAGCAMGCVFCATGQMGFFRHLTRRRNRGPGALFCPRTGPDGRPRDQHCDDGHGRAAAQLREYVNGR